MPPRGQEPSGRTNIGTVNLNANELVFGPDGTLTVHVSKKQPEAKGAQANWLPGPEGQFALLVRAYVPTDALLSGNYVLADVHRA